MLLSIFDQLIARRVKINYYNQLELLFQVFNSNHKELSTHIQRLDYTLEVNVFNFFINLTLDLRDMETGLELMTLVFEKKLQSVNLDQVAVSNENLKKLLMI